MSILDLYSTGARPHLVSMFNVHYSNIKLSLARNLIYITIFMLKLLCPQSRKATTTNSNPFS